MLKLLLMLITISYPFKVVLTKIISHSKKNKVKIVIHSVQKQKQMYGHLNYQTIMT